MGHSGVRTRLGAMASYGLAPLVVVASAIRGGRSLHPRGVVYRARVTAAADSELPEIAVALEGNALVRLSGAWWKTREWPDILGIAVRFTRERDPVEPPDAQSQDLLLASVRRPFTLPLAPFTTDIHDFLGNHYFGVAPFSALGRGQCELRLRPMSGVSPREPLAPREERLASAVSRGDARFMLEWRRRTSGRSSRGWGPLATLQLVESLAPEQRALRFDPFRAGAGLEPVGFVHGLRRATYAAASRARAGAAREVTDAAWKTPAQGH